MKLEYSLQFEQIWGYMKAILLIRWQTRLPGCLISIARLAKELPGNSLAKSVRTAHQLNTRHLKLLSIRLCKGGADCKGMEAFNQKGKVKFYSTNFDHFCVLPDDKNI